MTQYKINIYNRNTNSCVFKELQKEG
jgi:hypothetical protein